MLRVPNIGEIRGSCERRYRDQRPEGVAQPNDMSGVFLRHSSIGFPGRSPNARSSTCREACLTGTGRGPGAGRTHRRARPLRISEPDVEIEPHSVLRLAPRRPQPEVERRGVATRKAETPAEPVLARILREPEAGVRRARAPPSEERDAVSRPRLPSGSPTRGRIGGQDWG